MIEATVELYKESQKRLCVIKQETVYGKPWSQSAHSAKNIKKSHSNTNPNFFFP